MRRALVMLAVVGLAGCSRCGKVGAAPEVAVEDVLPKAAVGVVVVPKVSELGSRLQILQGLKVAGVAAQLQGFGDGKALVDALVQQLGVDVRSREALMQVGLAPDRGAGVAVMIDGTGFVALPVGDEAKLTTLLRTLGQARLGVTEHGEAKPETQVGELSRPGPVDVPHARLGARL